MPEDDPVKRIPINQLHQEPGDHELASSPDMKPYLDFIKAVIQDHDPAPELEAIRPVAPGKTIHLACGIGAEMGPCRLREHEHRGRQADFDTSRFRQGHGSSEIPAHAACHCPEGPGGRRRHAADDGRGDWGGETGIECGRLAG